ncbi:hypothetical protein [Argonema antarcticum]|uniref:hypothetical protein n=1 Tax=Argonema antarcticum TaxID=2942763 RepID=UPI002013AD0B|nr:hypothetical protein [Argonema antarcticum]MCL1473980.1 hypothetical protein [Argonema antarcticum A004/B2]
MTRFPHDQFAKDYLKELLTPLGQVETSRNVAGEVREIDVWFTPSSTPTVHTQTLGLLGRFATTTSIFEPFRNAVTASQIRSCMSKLFDVHADLERQAKRENTRINESDLPKLWILTPTASPLLLDGFGVIPERENCPPGVYLFSENFKTAIVAIHQLPRTPETLWLRILGKGTVQKQAINELTALPEGNQFRVNALELLYNLRVILDANQNLDEEDRELIMQLSPLYLERLDAAVQEGMQQGIQEGMQQGMQQGIQEGMQQGIQEGMQQGQRVVVENLLMVRFDTLDEELRGIVNPLLELPPEEFTSLLLQLSRDELLARFRK